MEVINAEQVLKVLGGIKDALEYDDKDDDELIEDALEYISKVKHHIIDSQRPILPELTDVIDYEDEDEDENYCNSCNGTGIPSSGPIDGSCSTCGGSGVINDNSSDDFDPDDIHERPIPDDWEP